LVLGQSKQALQNYEAGLSALNNNDAQKAIQLFKLAASKDSQYVDPAIALFQVYQDLKNFQSAIDYFNEIKKRDSAASIPFLVKQGVALASLGRYNAAYHLLTPYFQNNSLPHYYPPITLKYSYLSSSKATQYQIPHFLSAFLFLYLPSHLKYNTFQQIL
jgi:tetratricopeptide (TPR) repeat protein